MFQRFHSIISPRSLKAEYR